jgi:hypothetical protein
MKHRLIFAILMSCVLTFLMSAWVTFLNIGAVTGFVDHWLNAWVLAWPAAGVISFVFGPQIHHLAQRIANRV